MAIPTTFNGRLYRSTLEAKWASFFDLLGWSFEYEPFETEGWIPDFLIRGVPSGVLVEVKPVTSLEQAQEQLAKIERGACAVRWRGDLMLLGVSPWIEHQASGSRFAALGWLGESQGGREWFWARAPIGAWLGGEPAELPLIGFCHESGGYRDRITGRHDGGCRGGSSIEPEAVINAWNRAASRVQWSPGATPDGSIERMVRALGQHARDSARLEDYERR
jgi:hypothetical protein